MRMIIGFLLVCAPVFAAERPTNPQASYLPKDAKLVGVTQATEVRALPEQGGSNVQQEERVVGAHAVDRVWNTKQSYQATVKHLEQSFKSEGDEVLAKTTTPGATAFNVKMSDGHIANFVVRNTQPTTIESIQVLTAEGTIEREKQPIINQPSGNQPGNMQGNPQEGRNPQQGQNPQQPQQNPNQMPQQ